MVCKCNKNYSNMKYDIDSLEDQLIDHEGLRAKALPLYSR